MSTFYGDGVRCNNCRIEPIIGVRYACLECINYDLCDGCKKKGVHKNHSMAYLSTRTAWPYVTTDDGLLVSSIGRNGSDNSVGCAFCRLPLLTGYQCPQCPQDCRFCSNCFITKKNYNIHVIHPIYNKTDDSNSGHHKRQGGSHSKGTKLGSRFDNMSLEKVKTAGMRDVTATLARDIEKLMNKTVYDKNDLGTGRDADGEKFRRFKVTKVREIFMPEDIYALYTTQLANIRSKNPPRLGFEVDTSIHWLNKRKKKPSANEVFLFHGTKPESSEIIAKGGFDERVAALKAMYGTGIYFAENADKADHYTKHHDANRQMFLARVILGNPYKTAAPTSKFRRPPAIDEVADPTKRYDSVIALSKRKGYPTSKLDRYQEFIVYDRNQCIPAFLIDYVHEL